MRLQLDRSTRLLAGGAIVLGGRPARMLRLTPAGARLATAWRDGATVTDHPAALRLARRLIDTGLAHPLPDGGQWAPADVAVVIAAQDRPDLLAACLARVGPAAEVVVVDDGSSDPEAIAAVAREGGARVLRQAVATGPAGARNAGLTATTAPLVAFVDSDTRPGAGWLEPLLGHFEDAGTAAVAPRIAVPAGRGALAAYEAVRSPLDLGDAPGSVGPGRPIGFVPAAALVVPAAKRSRRWAGSTPRCASARTSTWCGAWRPRDGRCATSRPLASSTLIGPPPRAWLGQRVAYGSSAGPLARRHPGRLRHVVVPAWALAPWALVAAGRPRGALLASVTCTAVLAARLPDVPGARRQMLALAAGANLRLDPADPRRRMARLSAVGARRRAALASRSAGHRAGADGLDRRRLGAAAPAP